MKKEMTCINCPIGCHLFIEDGVITGNLCKRGYDYAMQELTNPKRIVTSTVSTSSNKQKRLSVKTSQPISKSLVFKVIECLREIVIDKDVIVGDIIIKNIFETGVDVVSTNELKI